MPADLSKRIVKIVAATILIWATAAPAAVDYLIEAGDRNQTFTGYQEDYHRCKARQEFTPLRGEYETKEEYRQRIERLRKGCDAYRVYEHAAVSTSVRLSYDVDNSRFHLELPAPRHFTIIYESLVRDDFPEQLTALPKDEWHVDRPTPRVSVYKECTLRKVVTNKAFIERVEAYRPNSWRGCMTYYEESEEDLWKRDDSVFSINDVAFYGYTAVDNARKIKDDEENLVYIIEGRMNVPDRRFEARRVVLRNLQTGHVLLTLEP